MKDLDKLYDEDWFRHDFTPLVGEFKMAAEAIDRMFSFDWRTSGVNDIGSGPGLLLRGLAERGWPALAGFDGSPHAATIAKELGGVVPELYDVTSGKKPALSTGLVICTEVAEHIPEEHAATLVNVLADLTIHACIFTAAPPGQDGHHHVNCQPVAYWCELFATRGMFLDVALTEEIEHRWWGLRRLAHMRKNVMVFR